MSGIRAVDAARSDKAGRLHQGRVRRGRVRRIHYPAAVSGFRAHCWRVDSNVSSLEL
jgi:hypothetical protein